jgi:hypothetical protein
MIQFYVLALAFMLYGAAVLLSDEFGGKYKILLRIKELHVLNQTFTIVMIVLTATVGLLKLIAPTSPGPVVIGDFLPAINLFALAVFFIFDLKKGTPSAEENQQHAESDEGGELFSDSEALTKVKSFYYKNKKILGLVTLTVAFFHFLFPGAVLL